MQSAISVRNLSKLYHLGAARGGYRTMREALVGSGRAAGGRLKRCFRRGATRDNPSKLDLWALKDVSLDVQPGEVIGLIGRNGAGKSTFLKVLSRITEPTEGRVQLRGRVGSLL